MAIRKIRMENDEILRKKSKDIDEIDERIKELAKDMIETMHEYDGVGLAAVQVGILKKLIVIDIYDDNGPIVMINPQITKVKGERRVQEGCLSFPNKFADVIRPLEVSAVYTDLDGNKVKIDATELLAQAICHELDHIEGKVFVDKMIKGTLEIVN